MHADNLWWSSVNGTIGSQPNVEAPRCLPCGHSKYGESIMSFPRRCCNPKRSPRICRYPSIEKIEGRLFGIIWVCFFSFKCNGRLHGNHQEHWRSCNSCVSSFIHRPIPIPLACEDSVPQRNSCRQAALRKHAIQCTRRLPLHTTAAVPSCRSRLLRC